MNLGAYGGTAQASKSYFGEPVCEAPMEGDINGDCRVDAIDAALAAQEWRSMEAPMPNQPPVLAISRPAAGSVIEVSPSDTIIPIVVDATDADGTIQTVWLYVEYIGPEEWLQRGHEDSTGKDGWQWNWDWNDPQNPYSEGQYTIRAYAIDDDGAIAFAPEITVTIRNAK